MPTVNIRQLRNTSQLKTWLQAGMTVELRERNRVIGHIVPEGQPTKSPVLPDFARRMKKIFGTRKVPGADVLIEERGRY